MFVEILESNFVTVVGILFSLVAFIKNRTLDKKVVFFFIASSCSFLVLVVVDSMDYYLASLPTLNNWRYFTSIIGYCLRPCTVLLIIYTFLRNDVKISKYYVTAIPFALNFLFCVTNPLTHWIFTFTEDNVFHRGVLGYLPFIISGCYLIILSIYAIKRYRYVGFGEIALVLFVAIAITASVVLETVLHIKFLLNGTGVISAIFYYLYLHSQLYKRDSLTSLLNRAAFFGDTKKISESVYIICIDMNNLKNINDTRGHMAGDEALVCISNTMLKNAHPKDRVYRVGGDEFVIVSPFRFTEVSQMMETIQAEINESHFSIAYGFEEYNPALDFEKCFIRADMNMYACKKKMKENE